MVRTAFQLSRGAWFLENTSFLKMLIFSQIRISNKSFLKVLRQFFASSEKIAIQVSAETFWRKNVLFLTDTKFFSFTDFNRCNCEHSKKTVLSVLSIRHSTYQEQRLDENSFLQRIRIVLPFLDFWMKNLLNSCRKSLSQLLKMFLPVQATFSRFFVKSVQILFVLFVFWLIQLHFRLKFLGQGLQNCTLAARGSFRGKTTGISFFFLFINRFWIWAKTFRFYGKNCAAALSKVHFFRQGNKTKEILFWKNVSNFNNFLTSGWIVPDPQWQFSEASSKSNFLFPRKYFGLKYVFQAKKSSSCF